MLKNKKNVGRALLGYLLGGAAALLVIAAVGHGVLDVLDAPEVHVSHSSGACVRVHDAKAEYERRPSEWSCNRLPPRYDRVWVP